jgi:hypothetical protein
MPWDEWVASLIIGSLSYTLWRCVKAFSRVFAATIE